MYSVQCNTIYETTMYWSWCWCTEGVYGVVAENEPMPKGQKSSLHCELSQLQHCNTLTLLLILCRFNVYNIHLNLAQTSPKSDCHLGSMNAWTKFHGNTSNTGWDSSVWIKWWTNQYFLYGVQDDVVRLLH